MIARSAIFLSAFPDNVTRPYPPREFPYPLNPAKRVSFYSHKWRSRRRDHNRGFVMRAQRVWKEGGADSRHAEIEQLHFQLTAFNNRIAELEKKHTESSMIETLKASAIVLARQIDEVRCSLTVKK
jgi:hypothetical protein